MAAHFIEHRHGQQRFNQADQRDHHRIRQHNFQHFQTKRHYRQTEVRQCTGDIRQIADPQRVQVKTNRHRRHHNQRRQRSGNNFGQFREQHDDGNCQQHQPVHQRTLPGDHMQLRQHNHNRQSVHKSVNRWQRHQPDKLPEPEHADQNLNHTGENRRPQHISHAVLSRQTHQNHDNRPRRAGDHSRFSAKQRRHQPDNKRRVQTDNRRQSGHQREPDRFRDHRYRHHKSRQRFILHFRQLQTTRAKHKTSGSFPVS